MLTSRKDKLIAEARERGLEVNESMSRDDIMNRMRTQAAVPQLPAMLAKNARDLDEKKLIRLCESGRYYSEPKIDGVRMKIHITSDGIFLDGRNRSKFTYNYCEYTAQCEWLKEVFTRVKDTHYGTVLDAEAVWQPVTKDCNLVEATLVGNNGIDTQLLDTAGLLGSLPTRANQLQERYGRLKFFVFDMLIDHYKDMRFEHWLERYRGMIQRHLELESIDLVTSFTEPRQVSSYSDFLNAYEEFIERGYEGAMLKARDATYALRESSRTEAMFKYKKFDTVDAFITGYTPGKGKFEGLVGGLEVSVIRKGQVECIGSVIPGSDACRETITNEFGELHADYYGKVVEVEFQQWTPDGKLRHPRLALQRPWMADLKIRADKEAGQCNV